MSDFIIDPKSVSFKQIKNDLMTYATSQPDASQWSVFFASNAGQQMFDYLAGLGAFLKMETIIARREGLIQFAQNRSSIVGKAQELGYSAYRGRNKVLSITIVPSTTGVLKKYDYVGTVRDRYLVVAEDTVVNAGVAVSLNVIVGEVLELTKTAVSTNLNVFRFTKAGVSQDCRIFIGTDEVEWSSTLTDMLIGKFFLQSNSFGSVDAKYLNIDTFDYRYMTGSIIKLQYISLKDIDFEDTEVKLYEDTGVLTGIETVSVYDAPESDESVKINAPLQNETKSVVRGREDQPKIFKTLSTDIVDAKGEDVSDAVMRIFLLRSNGIAFSPDEKSALQDKFEPSRPHGLLPPIIEDADSVPITLKIDIRLKKNSTTIVSDLVDEVLSSYKNVLKAEIVLPDIEEALETDSGVKIARVVVDSGTWGGGLNYRIGSYVKNPVDNGLIYRVKSFRHRSGPIEPTWAVIAKAETVDKEIVWKAVPKSDLAGINNWVHDGFYGVGDQVKPTSVNGFIYECVRVLYRSGSTEPTWTDTIGEEIIDGRLIWKVRAKEGINTAWVAQKGYSKGEIVLASSGHSTVMYQCIGYLGQSNLSVVPTFSLVVDETFVDKELVWETQDPEQDSHKLAVSQHFNITTDITVS